jgi:hypothetical protein
MYNFPQFWSTLVKTIKSSPRESPSTITILRDHIDINQNGELDITFKKDKHYFQVMVNEMYFTNARQWFNKIDPLVYVLSNFTYNDNPLMIPFLVGPSMLKGKGIPDEFTDGMIFRNINVSGLRPYRGGGLTLSVILLEARQNVVKPLMQVTESIAGALNFSPALSPYLTVANVLMESFDTLYASGGIVPLVGLQDSFGPTVIPFRPSYFALIDKPNVDPKKLWVRENRLVSGNSLEAAKPYREADFVLYGFASPPDNLRDDFDTLPFNETWKQVKKEASSAVEDPNYKNARILMANLYQQIIASPDLTEDQAFALADDYDAQKTKIHEHAKSIGLMGGEGAAGEEKDRQNKIRRLALDIAKGL